MTHTLIHGDCLKVLPTLETGSVDAVVTDPPAGIAFMGKEWDTFPIRDRGPLPGGSLPQQTPHKHGRGFANGMHVDHSREARDQFIAFLSGVMAECLRVCKPGAVALVWGLPRTSHWTATACEDAGWRIEDRISHLFGTGFPKHKSKLKPACEDWWVCRKPGPLWLGVEEGRIEAAAGDYDHPGNNLPRAADSETWRMSGPQQPPHPAGRWPANVCLDEEAARLLDERSGESRSNGGTAGSEPGSVYGGGKGIPHPKFFNYGDSGGVSRFFYVAKASKADRGEGNTHPTVKSTALMEWLVKLACPAGGKVLDPFTGSGSTGVACLQTGRDFVGIECDRGYFDIATRRVEAEAARFPLFRE